MPINVICNRSTWFASTKELLMQPIILIPYKYIYILLIYYFFNDIYFNKYLVSNDKTNSMVLFNIMLIRLLIDCII